MAHIVRWTKKHFGEQQARIYAETLKLALDALCEEGEQAIGAKARNEIAVGVHTLHVARQKRKGRHFIVATRADAVDVLRILHDSMDFRSALLPLMSPEDF